MKNKINFTEILLIIFSVIVLGWITFNQFELARAKSRDVDRKNSLNELGQIIRLYYADYGVLPSETVINSLWGKEWRDGDYIYLNKLPQENFSTTQYCYLVEERGKSFSLFANLENKADNECQKDRWTCGGQTYCYKHIMLAEIIK